MTLPYINFELAHFFFGMTILQCHFQLELYQQVHVISPLKGLQINFILNWGRYNQWDSQLFCHGELHHRSSLGIPFILSYKILLYVYDLKLIYVPFLFYSYPVVIGTSLGFFTFFSKPFQDCARGLQNYLQSVCLFRFAGQKRPRIAPDS